MKKAILFSVFLVLCYAQDKPKPFERPTIKSIRLMPGKPIVVSGCKVGVAGGYWSSYSDGYGTRNLTDSEIGQYVKETMKLGMILTVYPDEGGVFVTYECQSK